MPWAASTDVRWLLLPSVPESSGVCREFVRSAFEQWGLEHGLDDTLLLVSELCSNVIRHAGTPMVVGVVWEPTAHLVHVGVRDDSSGMPSVRTPGELAQSGPGLRIVDAVAQRWGVQPLPAGKIVWFELRVGARRPADPAPVPAPGR